MEDAGAIRKISALGTLEACPGAHHARLPSGARSLRAADRQGTGAIHYLIAVLEKISVACLSSLSLIEELVRE